VILDTVGGWRSFTREGKFVFDVLEFGTSVDDIQEYDVISISRERTDIPPLRLNFGYLRSYKVQDPDAVAAGAAEARKKFVAEEYRRVIRPDASGQAATATKFPTATELQIDSLFVIDTDASDEATRRATLLGIGSGSTFRERYNVTVRKRRFLRRPGETVTLTYTSRDWNIDDRDFIILGVHESSDTLYTTLRLWG